MNRRTFKSSDSRRRCQGRAGRLGPARGRTRGRESRDLRARPQAAILALLVQRTRRGATIAPQFRVKLSIAVEIRMRLP